MRNKHITATIIADSLNEHGNRITSLVIVLPRIVLAEFNTHRALSRNSASSRAIPFRTMVEKVRKEPFIPIKWQKDHKGMQGTSYIEKETMIAIRDLQWLSARDAAVEGASRLNSEFYNLDKLVPEDEDREGITKQLCNRLLEPFLYHTIIATATEWENFIALRANDAAEIHIADAAEKVLVAMNESTPKQLKTGEWHIPFGDKFDSEKLADIAMGLGYLSEGGNDDSAIEMLKVKIATARCARVSYLNYEGKDDYNADLKLYDRLSSMGHWSPFEHCARAMTKLEIITNINGEVDCLETDNDSEIGYLKVDNEETNTGWSGNFRGFIQLRKTFKDENKKDSRLLYKAGL